MLYLAKQDINRGKSTRRQQEGDERKNPIMASCEISPCYVRSVKTEKDQKNDANDWDIEEYCVSKIASSAHGPVLVG